jgi:histone-lysine N-methyltransferase SETD2
VQELCSEEACNGVVDGSVGEAHVSCSVSFVDVAEGSGDAFKNECENGDMLKKLEKAVEDDCGNSLGICSEDVQVSDLKSGGLCSEGSFQDEGYVDFPLESITSNSLQKHCAEQGEQKDVIEVSELKSGGLCSEGNFQDEGYVDIPLESITSDNLQKHCVEQGEQKDVIEVSDLKSSGLCSEGNFQDGHYVDLPLESITSNNLQKHCAEQGEQKDVKSIIFPSAGDDSEVMEGKTDGADLLAGAVNCVFDARQSEVCLESDFVTDLLVDYNQENEPEEIMRNADSLPRVVENCDALGGMDTNSCRQISPSLDVEVPSGVLYIDRKVESTSDILHDQKNGEDCDSTREEKIRTDVDEEITINSYVQANSSPNFQRILKTSPVVDSLCQPTLLDQGSKLKNGILKTEDNFCMSKDCSADVLANSTIRKPFYPESGQSSFVLITNSSPKDVPDLLSKGDGVSINNNCAVDNPGQTKNDGKEAVEVDCITESILLPSQRSSQRTKFGRKTQTRKSSRKSKNKASVTHPGGGMKINLEAARKRRSCLSKPARSSVWGLLGNIEQFIQHENELEVSEAMGQSEGKARNGHQGTKMIKNGASSSSLSSVQKHNVSTSTTRFRLKIKFGKENDLHCSNVLESVGGLASASYLGSDSGSQKVTNNSADKFSEVSALNNLESFRKDLDKDCVVVNEQIVNSQLENSKITEKSDGDAEEPCHTVPPERVVEELVKPINNSVIEPGTSPDSEVIDSIPEVQVGERHEDVHLAVLGSSNELNSNMDVTFGKREKKKDNLICSGNCITEDGSQGQLGNNIVKHSKNHRRKKNFKDVVSSLELPTSTELSKSVKSKELAAESLLRSGEVVLGVSTKALKVKSDVNIKTAGKTSGGHGFSEFQASQDLPSSTRPLGRKLPKSFEPIDVSTAKSKASDSTSRKKTTTGRKEKQKEPINKSEVKGKGVSVKVTSEVEDHLHPGRALYVRWTAS